MTTLDEAVARLRAWHQSDDHQHEDPDAFNADLGALLKDHAGLREKLSTSRTTCAYCEAVHELPCTFDDIRAHVEKCPKHPMAALRAELERRRERDAKVRGMLDLKSQLKVLDREIDVGGSPEQWAVADAVRAVLELLKEEP